MKRMNFKRKHLSYFVIWSVFISSLLLYSPDGIALSASGAPEVKIITPADGAVFDVSMVEFTGRISDDTTTPDKLSVKVLEQQSNSDMPVDITSDGKLTVTNKGGYAEFSYSKDFNEGSHKLSFTVADEEGTTTEVTQTFTIKKADTEQTKQNTVTAVKRKAALMQLSVETGTNPYLVEMNFIPQNKNDKNAYLPAEDMTQVPLDYKIRIVIRSSGSLTKFQPLLNVSSNKGDQIVGTENLEETTQLDNNIKEYIFTFTPAQQLEASTTYYVYLDPTISNDSGNTITPRFFKFTTINKNNLGDIHGNYANNTNACAYCHSTHNGKSPTLQGGVYGASSNNYCMACHDGTNGTPMPDKYNTHNQHTQDTTGQLKDSDSCTSCHNPHTSWTMENPNKLQSVSVKDSSGQSHFETLTYKKATAAIGNSNDFTLCLSCHNGTTASNIEQYYKDPTYMSQSGHNIKATDDSGSPLNGQLPCAECHETHGSNNIKMLKEELGNVKQTDADKYKTEGTTWTESNERQFCLKCHTNSTQIYGKTSTLNVTIPGHQPGDTQGCSTCHGGSTKSFIEAAHSPTKLTP